MPFTFQQRRTASDLRWRRESDFRDVPRAVPYDAIDATPYLVPSTLAPNAAINARIIDINLRYIMIMCYVLYPMLNNVKILPPSLREKQSSSTEVNKFFRSKLTLQPYTTNQRTSINEKLPAPMLIE